MAGTSGRRPGRDRRRPAIRCSTTRRRRTILRRRRRLGYAAAAVTETRTTTSSPLVNQQSAISTPQFSSQLACIIIVNLFKA